MASEPAHRVVDRARWLAGVRPGPVLVGVDGRSGSGKTDLAHEVRTLLASGGTDVGLVHLDDLYPGWHGLAAGVAVLCADVLGPLRAGRPAAYPSWDWHADRPGPVRVVQPADVVVVEGVGVLAAPCAGLLDLRVWLDAPAPVRRTRAMHRDAASTAAWWDVWAAQEEALLGPSGRPPADLVVDTVTAAARWARLDA